MRITVAVCFARSIRECVGSDCGGFGVDAESVSGAVSDCRRRRRAEKGLSTGAGEPTENTRLVDFSSGFADLCFGFIGHSRKFHAMFLLFYLINS